MRGEKERQREKGGNSSVVHLADDILCTPSVISFSSARMDRISSLSLSGMTASLKSLETPFPSVSRFSSLALFLSVAAIFPKLYELVTTLFSFLTSSLTFFISSWTRIQHLPRDRPSVSVSICLSTSLPALPLFLNSCLGQKLLGKKNTRRN